MKAARPRPRRLRLASAATATLLTSVALVGCTSAVGGDESDSSADSGGVLQVGTTVDLNPPAVFTNSNDTINTLIGAVYDSLVDVPKDSVTPEPSLAESWELSEDGLSLTLDLRDDVTFHSGRDFTSKDVEFSIKTWADPKWTVQFQRTAAAVTGFDTSDPNKIVLTFDHKLSNVFDLLDTLPIIDSESFAGIADGSEYVGTGPFVFKSWKPQSEVVLEKNEDYWGGEPKLDGVEVHIVPDAQSLTSQLRSKQLDLAIGVSNRDVDTLEDTGDFNGVVYEGSERQYYVGTNVTHPALKDLRVRQAIAYALDRERIVDEVFRGNGYPIVAPWPEYSPAYDEELNAKYSRDVDEAKKLVAAAGDIPTLPLEYSTASPTYEAIAQIVQANLKDVGIEVTLVPNEHPTHIEKLIGGKFEALWILEHAYAQWTPSTLAVTAYPFNADKNASNFVDADYKKHADAAWNIADGSSEEAIEAYKLVTQDLVENLFLIESNVSWSRIPVSKAVNDLAWTKRSELVLTDTWLDK